jgi:hypothetical protein
VGDGSGGRRHYTGVCSEDVSFIAEAMLLLERIFLWGILEDAHEDLLLVKTSRRCSRLMKSSTDFLMVGRSARSTCRNSNFPSELG